MSKEILGKSGRYTYIVNVEYDEYAMFDSFGSYVRGGFALSGLSECRSTRDVSVLSIVGEPASDISEVYLNGRAAVVNLNHIDCMSLARDNLKRADHLIMRRVDTENGVVQIIIPLVSGSCTCETLERLYGKCQWRILETKY